MTARADRLTKRAKTAGSAGSLRSSYPASSTRVFVDALERLNYSVESLLGDAGIRRADLDDPDGRIPCAAWGAMFRQALALRPMKNVGVRLATVTPFGAFPLIDYLIATSQSVGEGHEARTLYEGPAGGNAVVVQRLLKERGTDVSVRTNERAVADIRHARRAAELATVRFESAPGDQLQIDFGQKRVRIAGEWVRVFMLVAVV